MEQVHPLTTLGVYSDTSVSCTQVALVQTDSIDIFENKYHITRPYPEELKEAIHAISGQTDPQNLPTFQQVEQQITQHHIAAIQALLDTIPATERKIDGIGYSGHTLLHQATNKLSLQIGNTEDILHAFHIPVVDRFYQTDLMAGGQGEPIFPVFFEALARPLSKPLMVVSIGGLASLTYIGENGELQAFQTGPGNMLLDKWMHKRMGADMDFDGLWAAKGTIDERVLGKLLKTPQFLLPPPKAFDKSEFDDLLDDIESLSVSDGAATLTALTAQSMVKQAQAFMPSLPPLWIITGGGAFNPSIVKALKLLLPDVDVQTADQVGWDVASLEAQGLAFLAARSLFHLPISLPQTTGVEIPTSGGVLHAD